MYLGLTNKWLTGNRRSSWAQANQNLGLALLSGLGLGAGLMYLLDPNQGQRRRVGIWHQLTRTINKTGNGEKSINTQAEGDQGKAPNVTDTQPKGRARHYAEKPESKQVKGNAGKGAAKAKHAAKKATGVKTSVTRKVGPKKTAARNTSRSGEQG